MEPWLNKFIIIIIVLVSQCACRVDAAIADTSIRAPSALVRQRPNTSVISTVQSTVKAERTNVASTVISQEPAPNLPTKCYEGRFKFHLRESILNYFLRRESCDLMNGTHSRMDSICDEKEFAHTEYYNVTYLLACHHNKFLEICDAGNIFTPWGYNHGPESSPFLANFRAQNDLELVNRACGSVKEFLDALEHNQVVAKATRGVLDTKSKNAIFKDVVKSSDRLIQAEYSEWYIPTIPFCRAFACGGSKRNHTEDQTSVHDCMPRECRGIIKFAVAFDCILAVLIIVANALVLGVAARTRIMRNIPGYFKISLALADLTVGIFVLPCCIFVTYTVYLNPMPFRKPGHTSSIGDYLPEPLAYFIGFFVVMSFAVSIYTMAAASVDRYLAITKPFQYRQGHYLTKRRSAWAFAIIWLVAFFISVFPTFGHERMGISSFNIVLSVGVDSSIVYAVTIAIPLLAVWGLNGAMLKQVCADREKRSSIRARGPVSNSSRNISRTPSAEKGIPMPSMPTVGEECEQSTGNNELKKETAIPISPGYEKNGKAICPASYEGVIEKIKRKRRQMHSITARKSMTRKSSVIKSATVERRLARTLAIMIGAFTVALLPCIATLAAYPILGSSAPPHVQNQLASALYLASRVLLSNSFWNCIIYSIRNAHFRRAMWAIFLCRRKKINRRLRESLSMTQYRQQGARSISGVHENRSLSKSNSNSSNSTSTNYRKDHRRSTQMWSLASQSVSPSRKGSDDTIGNEPTGREFVARTMSCTRDYACDGKLKKAVERSESAPQPDMKSLPVSIDT